MGDLQATADLTCLTATHADGLSGHLLSRALRKKSVHQFGWKGGGELTGCSVAPVVGSSICWAWGC